MCFVTLVSASPVPQLGYGYPAGIGYAAPLGYAAPAVPKILAAPTPLIHAAAPVLHAAAPTYLHAAPAIHAPLIHKTIVSPPIVKHVVAEPIDPNPHYSFSYGVSDPHTGDNKHAEETLSNGVVHGSYSLAEPDGTIRKVTYTADKINGFNAVVEKSGVAHHVAPVAKVITPAIAHAPAVLAHPPIYTTGLHGPILH